MQKSLSLFLKELRHDNGKEKLSDMAIKLGVSASYLSTVENGKRAMHDRLFQIISKEYSLSQAAKRELDHLRKFEAKSLHVNTESLDSDKKDTVIKFLSHINDLSKEEMKTIQLLVDGKRNN
jgi:transcriptional regulator with XRE-family HTH domain